MSINEAVTYYLVGYDGQKSIWRTGRGGRDSHQPEKEVQDTGEKNGLVHQKYAGNASSWVGTALAALYMKGKSIWDHDAFFDHEDFWMSDKNTIYSSAKWAPKGCSKTIDLFVEEMWNAYRKDAPGQPGGKDNLKWIWDQSGGHFVQNSPEK